MKLCGLVGVAEQADKLPAGLSGADFVMKALHMSVASVAEASSRPSLTTEAIAPPNLLREGEVAYRPAADHRATSTI